MGTFTHPIKLYSSSGDHSKQIDALVDTGSPFASFPAPLLERLGIRPRRTITLCHADGRREEQVLGFVKAEMEGMTAHVHCIFAERDAQSLVGYLTLEPFLLKVDPSGRRLVPTKALWMQQALLA